MSTDLDPLRARIQALRDQLRHEQDLLTRREQECGHNINPKLWGEPVPDQTMGTRTISWTRKCGVCGLVQSTVRTRMKSIEVPDFGS